MPWWRRKDTGQVRLQAAYEARLGRMTLAWNQMEACLDTLIETLFWLHDMASVKVTQRPMSLERKLTAVRRAYNGIDTLAPHREECLAVMNKISDIMDMRHRMTHGVLVKCLTNGDVMLMNLRFRADGPTLDAPVIRAKKIDELVAKANHLVGEIAKQVEAISPTLDEIKQRWPLVAEGAAQRLNAALRRLPATER